MVSPSPSCIDLGVIFDSHLSFNDHIDYLLSLLLGKLCQINRVRDQSPVYERRPFSHPEFFGIL